MSIMARYVYASPIIPGKTEWIKGLCQQRTQLEWELANEQQKREFWQFLGIQHWTAWVQHLPQQDFFIHCFEGDSFQRTTAALQKKIQERHPVALWIQDFYKEGLGRDYADNSSRVQIHQILDIELEGPAGEYSCRGFCFPLLPGKSAAHVEYCKDCLGPKQAQFEETLKIFGIRKITKFFQQSEGQDYVVYYEEYNPEYRRLAPENHPSPVDWLSQMLESHTGLSRQEHEPQVELLISATPEAVALASTA